MAMTDATATTHIQRTDERRRSTQRADLLAPVVVEDFREDFRYVVRWSDGGWRVDAVG
jgi:hypothetical protein